MNRVAAAQGWTRRTVWVAAAVALVATVVPGWRSLGWSLLLGMLVGMLNFQLLSSGLRRVLGLRSGVAQGAFQMSSFIRLGLVAAVLFWAARRGVHLMALPLLLGVFLPEGLFLLRWYAGGGESDP